MTEKQYQFRVGLMVVVATMIGVGMVVRFGELQQHWQDRYPLTIQFTTASGLRPSAPVLMSGIPIGRVTEVKFAENYTGVVAQIQIRGEIPVPEGSTAEVLTSLLGDVSVEIRPGTGPGRLPAGSTITGRLAADPMQAIGRLENQVGRAISSLEATSDEWRLVARNMNDLMQTKEGDLNTIIDQTAVALTEFTRTMRTMNTFVADTNQVFADPQAQQNLKDALAGMPLLVNDTRRTIAATRLAMESVDANLDNLQMVTGPLAERGQGMVIKLDTALTRFDGLLAELQLASRTLNSENGSLQKLASDPKLYRNLEQSAELLALLLKNMQPVVNDLRIFSDRVARHPEVLGAGGVVRPSSGIKTVEEAMPQQQRGQSPPRPSFLPPLRTP